MVGQPERARHMSRRTRLSITITVALLLVAPVLVDRDGFPLSTYPMYARTRGDVVGFVTAYGVDAAGVRHELSMATIGESDDPLVVAGELRAAIRAGSADRRCAEIAARASDMSVPLRSIEVVTERYEVVERVAGSADPVDRTVHASCPAEAAS